MWFILDDSLKNKGNGMLTILLSSLWTLLLPYNSMADPLPTEIVTNYCPEQGKWRLLDSIQMYSLTEQTFDFLETGALIDIYGKRTEPECHFEVLEGISEDSGEDLSRRKYAVDHRTFNEYTLMKAGSLPVNLAQFKVNDSININKDLPAVYVSGGSAVDIQGLWRIKKIDKYGLVTLSDPESFKEIVVNYYELRRGQIEGKISLEQEITNINNFNSRGDSAFSYLEDFVACSRTIAEDLSIFDKISWQGAACHSGDNAKHYFNKHFDLAGDLSEYVNGSKKLQLLRCIQISMEVGTAGIYHNPPCTPGRSQRIKKYLKNKPKAIFPTRRPCVSKKLVIHLTEQFDKAMKCLNLDPQKLFPIINHESHFQLNVMSHTGALSVGQIVRGTYNNLRKNLSKKYRTVKKANPNIEDLTPLLVQKIRGTEGGGASGDCDELMEMAKESNYKSTTQNESDRLCGPFNPEREFLLTGLNYIENKRIANRIVYRDIPSKKKEKISHLLATWMHNAGSHMIKYHFNEFKQTYNFKSNTTATFQKKFERYLLNDHVLPGDLNDSQRNTLSPKLARRREIAGFVGHLKRSLRSLQENDLHCGSL